jgi:hydroxymethylpyrimidine/phosphomethylpyrimidine kinase
MFRYSTVLTIAGSDCSAGAGIQADLKTLAALGCYGLSVITALTAQNTQGVQGVHEVPSHFVEQQLSSIFNDIEVNAIKLGMLFSAKNIALIAKCLERYANHTPIVLDPVMVSQSGAPLLQADAIHALRQYLIPSATLLTPNLPEAEVLLDEAIPDRNAMQEAARKLSTLGVNAVLIKGGHLSGTESEDCLYLHQTQKFHWFSSPRVATINTHGTGCTLSTAITAFLAKGYALPEAVENAKQYITAAIQAGSTYALGQGNGPVHHFYQSWHNEKLKS